MGAFESNPPLRRVCPNCETEDDFNIVCPFCGKAEFEYRREEQHGVGNRISGLSPSVSEQSS